MLFASGLAWLVALLGQTGPALAGTCLNPEYCLCRSFSVHTVVMGKVEALAPPTATLRVEAMDRASTATVPLGFKVGDTVQIDSAIWGNPLSIGAKVIVPMHSPSPYQDSGTYAFGIPLLLTADDRAICFNQPAVLIPRKEAVQAFLASDYSATCTKVLQKYGYDPNATCDIGDGCAQAPSPISGTTSVLWLLLLLFIRRPIVGALLPFSLLLFTIGCSDSGGPGEPARDAGTDTATTAYCLILKERCQKGDPAACQELSAKCPFTIRPDQGGPG